jgi:hypothetical protein
MAQRWLKFFRSFFKRDWELSDYPITTREMATLARFKIQEQEKPESQNPKWMMIVEGLNLIGVGDTQEDAKTDLESRFRRYKQENPKMPRPGIQGPMKIEMESSQEITEAGGSLIEDFMQHIFNLSPGSYFISDLSSLHDFEILDDELDIRNFQRKIALRYNVDVSDIPNGNLAKIFQRIRKKREEDHG